MSTLIPSCEWEQLKALIEQGVSPRGCELFVDGEYIGTFIPHNSFDKEIGSTIRIQAEALATRANSVLPLVPVSRTESLKVDKYPHLAKARAVREAKRKERERVHA